MRLVQRTSGTHIFLNFHFCTHGLATTQDNPMRILKKLALMLLLLILNGFLLYLLPAVN
jgi:hypothetical protein